MWVNDSSRRGTTAALLFLPLLLLMSSPRDSAGQSAAEEAVNQGKAEYQKSCAFCHGVDATGARGPDLVRSPIVAHDTDGDKLGEVIRNGRPDKGMPPLPLSTAQIKAIAAFLHARAREALESADLPKSYPVEKLLTGNAEAGKAYFNGEGGCRSCHSPTGNLAGVARKYPPLELEARMLYPAGAPKTVTVILPSGRQIFGRVKHLDEFVVTLVDINGKYWSFSRDNVKVEVHDPLAAHRKLLDRLNQDDLHNLFTYLETLQ